MAHMSVCSGRWWTCLALLATLPVLAGEPKQGKPDLKSAGSLSFGPKGGLFVADASAASIYAIETGDVSGSKGALKVDGLDAKIAGVLGTSPREILVNDIAVNPASGKVYISVARGRGPDAGVAILRVAKNDSVELFGLDNVKYTVAALPDAPGPEAVGGRRKTKLRQQSITDMAFVDGRLLIAGLSNEEFSSSLRSIPYPFKKVEKGSIVKIFHGAHGRFETKSPVRTFVPFEIDGEWNILAAYTCTPLVRIPVSELKSGARVQGITIAELGNRNRPLDMISYKKGGKSYLLIANSSRGIMKVTTEGIGKAEGITERVGGGGAKGQSYDTIEGWKGIEQLDQLSDELAVVVRKTDSGLVLESLALP